MPAFRHHPKLRIVQTRRQRLGRCPGHEKIIARCGDQRGRGDARQIIARVETPPRADALEQVLGTLKMRRAMRDLGQDFLEMRRDIGRGMEEQWLRGYIGGWPLRLQNADADIEAARRVPVHLRPGIHQHEPAHSFGVAPRQLQPNQTAHRVAEEMRARDAGGVQHFQHVIGHMADGIAFRQRARIAARAALIKGDDAEMLFKQGALRRPEGGRTAKPGREDNRLLALPRDFVIHFPICATVAISTSAPGFTSPHWMQ